MDYVILGRDSYSVKGGIVATACQVLSPTDLVQQEPSPSALFRVRDSADRSSILTSTMFGQTFDTAGTMIPTDDGRPLPEYVLCDGFGVVVAEYPTEAMQSTLDTVVAVETAVKRLRILNGYRSLPDVTLSGLTALDARIDVLWAEIRSYRLAIRLRTGGIAPHEVAAAGLVIPGSFGCSYDDLTGSYSISFNLMRLT